MENRGIDLSGRVMRYAPWPVDGQGRYRSPSEREIRDVYGISGAAVRETFLYFKACGGDAGSLTTLLNRHVPAACFGVSGQFLQDAARWYTNEFYFYFQMFAKRLIGRATWHFGENAPAQLSEYHKIWEKGPLSYMPYGGRDKDSTFSMIRAILDNYTARGVDCSDVYQWADSLCRQKSAIGFGDDIAHIRNTWLCSEFWYYLIEFVKIVTNINSTARIVAESFDYYELAGFSFAPEGMLLHVLQYMLNRSTRAYRLQADYDKGGSVRIRLTRAPGWDAAKTDKYFASATRNGDEAIMTAYQMIIMKFFRLDVPPEVSEVKGVGSGRVSFRLRWGRRLLPVPYLPLLAANTAIGVLYAALHCQRPGLLAVGLITVNGVLMFYRYVRHTRHRLALLKTHLKKQMAASEARVEHAERMAADLLAEKKRLAVEKQETARRLRITEVYTRKSLVNIIAAGEDPTCFPSVRRAVCVLFADIYNFTGLSENKGSLEIVALLNRFFDRMNECIIKENGEIDKLMGDGIMAVFTDPDSCLRAAIRMNELLADWNTREGGVNGSAIKCGIGINYGRVVIGNIGSENKMDYTVIGDIVNAASRLEALTRHYRTGIIISEEFKRQLRWDYCIQFLDVVQVKGRREPTRIYEVYDHLDEAAVRRKQAMVKPLDYAFNLYQQGNFARALDAYSGLTRQVSGNGGNQAEITGPVIFYRERCRRLLQKKAEGTLGAWDGVYYFSIK